MENVTARLRGYAVITAECASPERFLNLCAMGGVDFWGVRRIDEYTIELAIARRSLSSARKFADKTQCVLLEQTGKGLPFFAERFKHRYGLMAGFVLCFFVLLWSGQYVWDFSVEGNELLTNEEVLAALAEIGIDKGTKTNDIDIVSIRNKLLVKLPEIAWVSVNLDGSLANVVIREIEPKPEIIPKRTPTNVVAAKPGQIVRVDALLGSTKVFPGEFVEKGDLVISGVMDSVTGLRMLHAHGDITAKTWYDFSSATPTTVTGKRYTGREEYVKYIIIMNKKIKIKGCNNYEFYDKIKEVKTLSVSDGISLPISLVTETFREYTPSEKKLDIDLSKTILEKGLQDGLISKVTEGTITTQQITFDKKGELLLGKLSAECLEQIAVITEIPK